MEAKLPLLLIFLGFVFIVLGSLLFLLNSDKKDFSGLILIGPIPIPIGNFPLWLALLLSLLVFLLFYLFPLIQKLN